LQAIGQALEDMQAQNQRLLQEIIQRDDYIAQVRIHAALYTLDIHAFLACHLGMKVIAVWRFFA
jgi:hypothetical protein